jgi:argininosuccinate lyase
LVRKGVPVREAHHLSGAAVAMAEKRGVGIDALDLHDWRSISPKFDADIGKVFGYERDAVSYEQSVASRDVAGGTSPRSIKAQIKQARVQMNTESQSRKGAKRNS